MNKRTLLRLCLPHSAARAGRVHPLLLARALLRRSGRQGQLQIARRPRAAGGEPLMAALELAQVEHLEQFEHIEYASGFEIHDEAEHDAPPQGGMFEIGRENDDALQAI